MKEKGFPFILGLVLSSLLLFCSCRSSIKISDTKPKGIDIRHKDIPQLIPILDKESFDEIYAKKIYMHKNKSNKYINNDSYENALIAFNANYKSKIQPFSDNESYGYIKCKLIDYSLKNPLWPAFIDGFFVFIPFFVGVPLAYAKAEQSIEIQILNLNDEVIKSYRYNTTCTKRSGLYNGFPANYVELSLLGAFKESLNRFNIDLLTDADYIKNNLISTAKGIKADCLETQYGDNQSNISYEEGYIWLQQSDYDRSIKSFTESLSKSTIHSPSFLGRAIAKYNKGEYMSALKDVNRVIQLAPQNDYAHYYKSVILFSLKRYTEANYFITKGITIDSKNENYHYLHGIILESMGYFDDAITEYRNVLILNPDRVEVENVISLLRERIKTKENEIYNANLETQKKVLQIINTNMHNFNVINNNISTPINNIHNSRTKLQIQADIDKAERLLSDMKKNQKMQYERMSNDKTSGISGAIYADGYARLIKKQEQKIRELENELRNAK